MQVGVRVRPFNDRERDLGAQLCVRVEGQSTILLNPEKDEKKYTFDASFWSHDGFKEAETGYSYPDPADPGKRYADQQQVFETFGQKVLDNAWEGYNCCLFAYGQTGSGKSYSMVGYGANKGIVPKACEEIFRRIQATGSEAKFEVSVSMIEIYNEAVQDLLIHYKKRPKGGLPLRESKEAGFYVQGVGRRAVASYADIDKVIEEGTNNRSIGATEMNATSSRAHTVNIIEFKQVRPEGTKASTINLVDLAGSEKIKQTGATKDRLAEACNINKSLSALGNVIEKLADVATSAKKDTVIPYRDSTLTKLLKNALGGSSKTVMICAISPALSNYEESLSTLRYAHRAKQIKNAAVVNMDPQERLINQLKRENEQLKQLAADKGPGQDMSSEEIAAKEAEIAQLNEELALQATSFQQRLEEAKRLAEQAAYEQAEQGANLALPHLSNLNEDELLTNKVQFTFKQGLTRVGRGGAGPAPASGPPDIAISGPGIQPEQAVVNNNDGVCLLCAIGSGAATTFVNGKNPDPSTNVRLAHGDRIAFGSSIFVFVDPARGEGLADKLLESGRVSYTAASKEVSGGENRTGPSEEELAESKRKAEELERQVRAAEEAKQRAEFEANAALQQREAEYQAKIAELKSVWDSELQAKAEVAASSEAAAAEQARQHAEQLATLQQDFDERKKQAAEDAQRKVEALEKQAQEAVAKEEQHRQEQVNLERLDKQLMHMLPLVKEANLIAEELNRPQRVQLKMRVELHGGRARNAVRVSAGVRLNDVEMYEWTPEVLDNRVSLMRELLDRCDNEGKEVADNLKKEHDPWWDPVKAERQIGIAQVILQSLTEQLETEYTARILSSEGREAGKLQIEIWPVSKAGTPGIPDEEVVDDLLGSRMVILLKVVRALGLPAELATDVRVEYTYFIEDEPQHVPAVQGFCCDPEFNYEKTFVQDPVTSRFLEYINSQSIAFYVYGRNIAAEQMQAGSHQVPPPLTSAAASTAPVQPSSQAQTSSQAVPALVPAQAPLQAPSAEPVPAAAPAPVAPGSTAATAPAVAESSAARSTAASGAPAASSASDATAPLKPASEPAAVTKETSSQCCSVQ